MNGAGGDDTFQNRALEAREPDDDFDPSLPPETGDEFLTHMLYERRHLPSVVVRRPYEAKELAAKTGAVKKGTAMEGAAKTGAIKKGTVMEAAAKTGAIKKGTVMEGAAKTGAIRKGTSVDRAAKEGAMYKGGAAAEREAAEGRAAGEEAAEGGATEERASNNDQNAAPISTTGLSSAMGARFMPTNEWKMVQISDFKAMRCRIIVQRSLLAPKETCRIPREGCDDADWEEFCRRELPVLTTILPIGQRVLEPLLERLSRWLDPNHEANDDMPPLEDVDEPDEAEVPEPAVPEPAVPERAVPALTGKDNWLGAWLYATLACLRLPLEPHVHSTLRDIARTCVRQRDRLEPTETKKARPFNLFLTIIAHVYDQSDFQQYI